MSGACRACARNTDRTWQGILGKPGVPLCLECTREWEASGEKQRADKYTTAAHEQMAGSQAQKDVVLGGIIGRALVDFLYRIQKQRMVRGQAATT